MYDEDSAALAAKIAARENRSPEYREHMLQRWILIVIAIGVAYPVVKDFFV